MPQKLRIFLDTSVIISALNSNTGASFESLNLARKGKIILVITPYVLKETNKVIKDKFPKLLPFLEALKKETLVKITKDPSIPAIIRSLKIIKDPKDAPILAAAIRAKPDYLVTLDRKDFIDDPQISKRSELRIITPGGIIKLLKDKHVD